MDGVKKWPLRIQQAEKKNPPFPRQGLTSLKKANLSLSSRMIVPMAPETVAYYTSAAQKRHVTTYITEYAPWASWTPSALTRTDFATADG